MARRRRRGGRKSKTIPVLPVLAAVYPAYTAYNKQGFTKLLPMQLMYEYTGFNMDTKSWAAPQNGFRTLGTVIAGYAGHMIANKTGVNKWIRKATFGYLSL